MRVACTVTVLPAPAPPVASEHEMGFPTVSAQDVATVQDALSTPLAQEAASAVGADLSRVRTGVSTLSDAELSNLAARASVLQSDPVAGAMDRNMRLLIMIALILVIIVLVLSL